MSAKIVGEHLFSGEHHRDSVDTGEVLQDTCSKNHMIPG